jgi:hypothetical protein
MLEAQAARLDGRTQDACAAWLAATSLGGTGLRASELHFRAWMSAGRVQYVRGDAAGVASFEAAAALADRWACPHDEASVLPWLLLTYQRHGTADDALRLEQRAASLPTDGPGLPVSVRARLRAATHAKTGDLVAAVSVLDQGILEAASQDSPAGYAALCVAKAGLCSELNKPYFAWRTLRLAEARLRGWGNIAEWSELVKRARLRAEELATAEQRAAWDVRLGQELRR